MIKLSDLKDTDKVIDENLNVYDVEDVKNDLQYFKDKEKKLYTITEYYASIDATDMLKDAIENEYDNMYEDWGESILSDITEEDIQRLQAVIDDILNRNKKRNITCYQGKEIKIDL